MNNESFMDWIDLHERAWLHDRYEGQPISSEMAVAHVLAFWYPTKASDKRYTASVHTNLRDLNTHLSKLLIECKFPPPEKRLARLFIGSPEDVEDVRRAATPKLAAAIGRDRKRPLRPDWESVKDDVMRRGVLAKFRRYAAIRDILLSTGDEEIVENSPGDRYWGIGADGTGQNRLGTILMETRAILRAEAAPPQN